MVDPRAGARAKIFSVVQRRGDLLSQPARARCLRYAYRADPNAARAGPPVRKTKDRGSQTAASQCQRRDGLPALARSPRRSTTRVFAGLPPAWLSTFDSSSSLDDDDDDDEALDGYDEDPFDDDPRRARRQYQFYARRRSARLSTYKRVGRRRPAREPRASRPRGRPRGRAAPALAPATAPAAPVPVGPPACLHGVQLPGGRDGSRGGAVRPLRGTLPGPQAQRSVLAEARRALRVAGPLKTPCAARCGGASPRSRGAPRKARRRLRRCSRPRPVAASSCLAARSSAGSLVLRETGSLAPRRPSIKLRVFGSRRAGAGGALLRRGSGGHRSLATARRRPLAASSSSVAIVARSSLESTRSPRIAFSSTFALMSSLRMYLTRVKHFRRRGDSAMSRVEIVRVRAESPAAAGSCASSAGRCRRARGAS